MRIERGERARRLCSGGEVLRRGDQADAEECRSGASDAALLCGQHAPLGGRAAVAPRAAALRGAAAFRPARRRRGRLATGR